MGFPRCFFGRLNLEFNDRGYCPNRLRVCNRKQRRRWPPRSTPAIVDLPHQPDAAAAAAPVIAASAVASPVIVASAVAVAIAIAIAIAIASASASARPSKPAPFTNRIPSFVKKMFKTCGFSRGSWEGSAGVELVRESREGQAQGPQMHVQSSESSAEESMEGLAAGELVREGIEGQGQETHAQSSEFSAEESRGGLAGGELVREGIEDQGQETHAQSSESSAEESREGLAGGELVREGIEGQGQEIHAQSLAEESREGVEQAETTQGPEIERQFAKSSVTAEEAEIGVQSPAIVAETEDQFTESSVMTEQSSFEESREGMEEANISHRPEIEAQFTELSVIVEEAKIGHGRGSEAQSLGLTILAEVSLAKESREEVEDPDFEYGEIIDSPRNVVGEGEIEGDTVLEEGEIIDSPSAVMEESETDESTRAEVEDGEIIESSWNEVEKVPLAFCSSSAQANSIFSCYSGFEKLGELSFSFACTEPVSESTTRHYRRKSSRRIAITSIPSTNPHILSVGTDLETRQESQSSVIGDTAYETCKMWLKRGNEAYGKDHFSKAESFYTCAVNFAFEIRPWGSCIQALTLCHGNRAATRMYLGRMRDAIGDCEITLSIDPNFLRARVRMASCYLALGDIEAAMNNYNKCFQSLKDTSSERNRKILVEASDGLKKAQLLSSTGGH